MKIEVQNINGTSRIPVGVNMTPDFSKSYAETVMIRNNQIVRMQQGFIKQLKPEWYKSAMAIKRNQTVAKCQ